MCLKSYVYNCVNLYKRCNPDLLKHSIILITLVVLVNTVYSFLYPNHAGFKK